MNIGFVGLGKLGLPCALAVDSVNEHTVVGYDIDKSIKEYLEKEKFLTERRIQINFYKIII